MAKKKNSNTTQDPNNRVVTSNRRARHNFEILTTYDAGLVLLGSEIKSIRAGKVNLADGYVQEQNGELWLFNMHIALYPQASHFGHTEPMRPRKLLLHKKEIAKIITDIREISYTAVPTKLYLSRGMAKVEIATARGKRLYDKRDDLRKRDSNRRIERALKDL
ncbi:MAG: SsrA-binding protein SmpB [Phototrophicaceae bacterium]